MDLTLGGMIRARAADRGDRPAITYQERSTSYAELDARASRVANALIGEGVGPGDRVAFLDHNSPEYFEVLLGGGKVGAVSVAVNWRLHPSEMAWILNDSQASVLVVGTDLLPALDEMEPELESVRRVVVLGDHPRHPGYEAWIGDRPADDPDVEVAPDDVAMLVYTSGTTGLPKGAMIPHRNLFALVPYASAEWGFGPESVSLVVMPLFHIAGSGWGLVGLYLGAHNVLLRAVDPAAILAAVPEHRITHTIFVPAVMQLLMATPGVTETDFSSLRTVVYGASPITREVLVRAIETFGCEFSQAYGLSETTGAVVMLPAADHHPDGPSPERLRAAGVAMPGVELRIVDPGTGADVPTGAVGEVWIRSGQVMRGYWNRPEDTAGSITPDGWFRSGDAGYLDEHGYLFIQDRVKDMIITGGENVYPIEVENVLMTHPGVADVAVIGVPDDRWGEAVKAIVVRAPGIEATEAELVAHAREHLAHYKCPTSVAWADELPRNPSGKILKRELRAPYWEGQERAVH
ncbi:MAG: fatty acid--CoA ligase [Acidimicrobiia bacterium]|nr:fatty acid--CoA ligase [Acidimicrobiia bacterium]